MCIRDRYSDAGLYNQWDFETNTVTEDTTLYAKWTIKKYTVTFQDHNGSELKTETVEYGLDATAPNDPERTGYTFTNWDVDFTNVAGDLTVIAQYKINQYTITFDTGDGGSEIDPITQNFGTAITPPANPTRDDYIFNGWNPELPANMPAGNMTLTAQWAAGDGYNIATGPNVYTNPSKAKSGTPITINVTPDEGQQLLGLAIKDSNDTDISEIVGLTETPGQEGQEFTFTMPASDVTVAVSYTHLDVYKRQPQKRPKPSPQGKITRK